MKRFSWHSIFITLYSVVFLYAENIKYVKLEDIYSPLLYVSLGALVVFILAWLVYRKIVKAGIITTVLLLLFFSYGHYHGLLYPQRIPVINVRFDHNFYKWSSLIICLFMFWRLWLIKSDQRKTNSILNFVSLLLLAMPVYKIIEHQFDLKTDVPFQKKTAVVEHIDIETKPSIYYLIMDAYGRNDVLKELYDYDNSEFTDYLKDKGFFVADQSFSNYNKTVLSIPSSMNMMYLDSIADELGHQSENQTPLLQMIDRNRTVNQLDAFGYTSFAFDAPILPYLFFDSADLFYETPGAYINLFENELINTSIIRAFKRKEAKSSVDQWEHHRKKILTAFDKIEAISKRDEPYYVHGHILAPHQPFVFGAEGEPLNPEHHYTCWMPIEDGRDPQEYREEYIAQLKFINKKLIQTVDAILANSKTDPIIIIQGDHGPCAELTNTQTIEGNNFFERMPIINAYYFPEKKYSSLYPSISPVNTFRVVFNQYFNKNYKLLPDSSFYSTWKHHYDFVNVTDSLN
ncbi:MAG: hypothetical protein JXR19_09890 [Bacteroidia bacterium]